jgi:hypothetical protein
MPEEKKEIPIPITGIQLMKELSLDAHMMIYLASEGILLPFRPPVISESYMKLLMGCNYDTAIDKVTDWRYRKADVEHFKLNYKDYLEGLRLSHGLYPTAPEPQSDTIPESPEVKDAGTILRKAQAMAVANMVWRDLPHLTMKEAAMEINARLEATEAFDKDGNPLMQGYSVKHLMKLIKPLGFKPGKPGRISQK